MTDHPNLSSGTMYGLPWDMIMAGSVISIIPTVSAVVFLRRQFIEGITAGAVKG